MPVELRLSPAWRRDTLTMSHASPARCLWGGLSKAHQRCHKTPRPHLVLLPGKAPAAELLPLRHFHHGWPWALQGKPRHPGLSRTLPIAAGCPRQAAVGLLMARGAAPSSCRGRVPYLTLLRETPALSPLTICFQGLIQETHVLSIYLEKKK